MTRDELIALSNPSTLNERKEFLIDLVVKANQHKDHDGISMEFGAVSDSFALDCTLTGNLLEDFLYPCNGTKIDNLDVLDDMSYIELVLPVAITIHVLENGVSEDLSVYDEICGRIEEYANTKISLRSVTALRTTEFSKSVSDRGEKHKDAKGIEIALFMGGQEIIYKGNPYHTLLKQPQDALWIVLTLLMCDIMEYGKLDIDEFNEYISTEINTEVKVEYFKVIGDNSIEDKIARIMRGEEPNQVPLAKLSPYLSQMEYLVELIAEESISIHETIPINSKIHMSFELGGYKYEYTGQCCMDLLHGAYSHEDTAMVVASIYNILGIHHGGFHYAVDKIEKIYDCDFELISVNIDKTP